MESPDQSAGNQPRSTRFPSARISGFTLPELLVSIVVLSIVVGLLFLILNQVSKTWTQIRAQIDRHQNARSVLNVMASELRLAALPVDRYNTSSLQMVVDPVVCLPYPNAWPNSTTYLNAHAVFWQAPIATDTSMGNMAEIGYFVRWDTTSHPGNPRAILCRYFVNPASNNSGTETADSNYLIRTTPSAWLSIGASGTPGAMDTVAPGTAASNYKGWFADNVIGLWVRCLDGNGFPIYLTGNITTPKTTNYAFDSRQSYGLTPLDWNSSGGSTGENVISKSSYSDNISGVQIMGTLPSAVEIAIVVIDAQTANDVTAIPSYAPAPFNLPANIQITIPKSVYANEPYPFNFWNDINFFVSNLPSRVQHGAHIYSIRVPLVNGG